ncbi:FAD-dependent oxidoreductase [Halalkalibacter hemicellulosilyticus]|uniref:Oxidoreductase n=1 Tax=Halalkalibacter hemicellulosilyticusJCM 9152 TaxID=1236971 RepID=W4QBA7_9BACI|nr:FAD-dependent oxidoreductase [Halalkalibacter hemicellulosilyticus]GAE28679.1 oxidoreductase [Halalkalibacter hemicellulosilyticusJCM 9152]
MAFFQDMVSIFKKRELPFIESVQETEGVYTFRFKKKEDVTWKAGQHGLFTITHQKIKDHTRPFTIASIPKENMIQLTMNVSDQPSEFKKAMLSLENGDTIKMAGPVGSFYLKEDTPTVLIAGGIGITPFRSMIKQIEADNRSRTQIQLLYLESTKAHLFQEELDDLAKKTSVQVTYLDQRDDLNKALDMCISEYSNNGHFFVAGPKSMVAATTTYLQKKNIRKRHIKKDTFYGY